MLGLLAFVALYTAVWERVEAMPGLPRWWVQVATLTWTFALLLLFYPIVSFINWLYAA